MTSVTTLPFRPDGWTVDDLDDLPDDGYRYELVDGALLVSPPPSPRHDAVVFEFAVRLRAVVGPQWRVLTTPGVHVDSGNYRQPDIVVCRRDVVTRSRAWTDDVLLAVEVMSPGSVSNDRVSKPALYAAHGIPHFWRVELDPLVLVTHVLDDGVYRETGRHTDQVAVDEPVSLRFRLPDLLV